MNGYGFHAALGIYQWGSGVQTPAAPSYPI